LTLRLRLTTAIHLEHSQILTKYYYITIRINGTLLLHAKLSLSRDRYCKTYVNQRLFSFFQFLRKASCFSLARDYISKNPCVKIISGYWFGRESWVLKTFLLLSQCIEPHMTTGVPSPIISMTERTALCRSTGPTRKQRTRV